MNNDTNQLELNAYFVFVAVDSIVILFEEGMDLYLVYRRVALYQMAAVNC